MTATALPAAPIILVTTGHPTLHQHPGPNGEPVHPFLGRLLQPRHLSSVELTAEAGIPWAADNDCFQGLDERAYRRMLDRLEGLPGCLFVTVPDVVGDAATTLEQFDAWAPELEGRGFPLGLVAQDGMSLEDLAERADRLAALFIGGSTEWKEGPEALDLARAAKAAGLWVHWGRVNTRRRFDLIVAGGAADSFDGSKWARFRKTYLPGGLEWLEEAAAERDRVATILPLDPTPLPIENTPTTTTEGTPAMSTAEQIAARLEDGVTLLSYRRIRPEADAFIVGVHTDAGVQTAYLNLNAPDGLEDLRPVAGDTGERIAAELILTVDERIRALLEADAILEQRRRVFSAPAFVPTDEQIAKLAEYNALSLYDAHRRYRYGDMAGTRRGRELNRRAGELIEAGFPLEADGNLPSSTREALRDAYRRVILPRYRRFAGEPGAVYGTQEARATAGAYAAVALRLGFEPIVADVELASERRARVRRELEERGEVSR